MSKAFKKPRCPAQSSHPPPQEKHHESKFPGKQDHFALDAAGAFWLYVLIAAGIGTFYILYTGSFIYTNATLPGPMPVLLPNGFQFAPDWETKTSNQHITDKNGKQAVAPDVKMIMWHGDTVYGYRRGHAGEIYYFICVYGEDCSGRQHMNDTGFNRALKDRGLPEFVRWERKGYWELLVEQDKRDQENEKNLLKRKGG